MHCPPSRPPPGGHWLGPSSLGAGAAAAPAPVLPQGCSRPGASVLGRVEALALRPDPAALLCWGDGQALGQSPPWSPPHTVQGASQSPPSLSALPPLRPLGPGMGGVPQNGPSPLLLFAGKSSGGEVAGPPAGLPVSLDRAAHPPARPPQSPAPSATPPPAPPSCPLLLYLETTCCNKPEMDVFSRPLAASFFRLVLGGDGVGGCLPRARTLGCGAWNSTHCPPPRTQRAGRPGRRGGGV